VRRIVGRSLIDSSSQKRAGIFFASSVAVSNRKNISAMDHPPYSPDLAPTDFWLLPKETERKAFLGC
jgi:hypothetical protein